MKAKRIPFWVSFLAVAAFAVSFPLSACGAPAGAGPAKNSAPVSEKGNASANPAPVSEKTNASAQAAPPQSPAPASGAAAPSAAVTGGDIPVTLRNLHFPKEIRVKAGAKVVFVITNEGDETHSFEFPDLNLRTETKPGKTTRLEWTVPDKKGKWDMGCYLTEPSGVHEDMEGTLIIE